MKEANWLPRLAPRLPFDVPVPAGVGQPDEGFPWMWSVHEWIEGEPVTRATDKLALARDVADFLNALHSIDVTGGPPPGQHSFLRGADPVTAYGAEARRFVDTLDGIIDTKAARAVLDSAAQSKVATPVWAHGDIAVGNLLTRHGRLSAVIDFGCSAVGDPSCDLVLAWVFLDGESRAAFRSLVTVGRGGMGAGPGVGPVEGVAACLERAGDTLRGESAARGYRCRHRRPSRKGLKVQPSRGDVAPTVNQRASHALFRSAAAQARDLSLQPPRLPPISTSSGRRRFRRRGPIHSIRSSSGSIWGSNCSRPTT